MEYLYSTVIVGLGILAGFLIFKSQSNNKKRSSPYNPSTVNQNEITHKALENVQKLRAAEDGLAALDAKTPEDDQKNEFIKKSPGKKTQKKKAKSLKENESREKGHHLKERPQKKSSKNKKSVFEKKSSKVESFEKQVHETSEEDSPILIDEEGSIEDLLLLNALSSKNQITKKAKPTSTTQAASFGKNKRPKTDDSEFVESKAAESKKTIKEEQSNESRTLKMEEKNRGVDDKTFGNLMKTADNVSNEISRSEDIVTVSNLKTTDEKLAICPNLSEKDSGDGSRVAIQKDINSTKSIQDKQQSVLKQLELDVSHKIKELDIARNENAQLKNQLVVMEQELGFLKKIQVERDMLRDTNRVMTESIVQIQQNSREHQEKLKIVSSELNSEREQLQDLKTKYSALSQDLNALKKDESRINDLLLTVDRLKKECSISLQQVTDAQHYAETLRTENARLTQVMVSLEEKHRTLKDEYDHNRSSIASKLEEMKSNASSLNTELKTVKQELAQEKTARITNEKEAKKIAVELKKVQQERDEVKEEVLKLRSTSERASVAEKEKANLLSVVEDLKSTCKSKEEKIVSLQSEVNQLHSQLEDLNKSHQEKVEKLGKEMGQLKTLKQNRNEDFEKKHAESLSKYQTQLETVNRKVNSLTEEKSALENNIRTLEEDKNSLQEQIGLLERNNVELKERISQESSLLKTNEGKNTRTKSTSSGNTSPRSKTVSPSTNKTRANSPAKDKEGNSVVTSGNEVEEQLKQTIEKLTKEKEHLKKLYQGLLLQMKTTA